MAQIVFDQRISIRESQMATWFVWPNIHERLVVGHVSENNDQQAFVAYYNQNPEKNWTHVAAHKYGTYYHSAALVDDQLFVCCGGILQSAIAEDEGLLLQCFDRSGKLVWQDVQAPEKTQMKGYQVSATRDGGFIVTCMEGVEGSETIDTRVIKYQRTGDGFALSWWQTYKDVVAFAVVESGDEYLLAGRKHAADLFYNPHIFRIDARGEVIWANTVTEVQSYVLLNTGITATADGDFVVAAGAAIVRIDGEGKVIWAQENNSVKLDSVAELPNGELAFAGVLITQNMDKAYLVVLDPAGETILWDNTSVLFNSAASHVAEINGLPVCCGFGPLKKYAHVAWLAAFAHETLFAESGATPFAL